MAARHETVLAKETRNKVHTTQTHNAGNASTPSLPDGFRGKETNGNRRHCVATSFPTTTQAEVEKSTEPD